MTDIEQACAFTKPHYRLYKGRWTHRDVYGDYWWMPDWWRPGMSIESMVWR